MSVTIVDANGSRYTPREGYLRTEMLYYGISTWTHTWSESIPYSVWTRAVSLRINHRAC
jgi:hypothetical protein